MLMERSQTFFQGKGQTVRHNPRASQACDNQSRSLVLQFLSKRIQINLQRPGRVSSHLIRIAVCASREV